MASRTEKAAARRPAHRKRSTKQERLSLRLTAEQKRQIERAAALSGQSLTDYVVDTVNRQSLQALRDWEVLRLSDRDRDTFLAALDRAEARPLPRLTRAARRHRKALG